ncbi:hypothetical protein LPJ53_002842 [Coemansia erecta]|uniref:Inosine/uridine-preferring nucleoside hydrolase domain-containing protein n=1 Tax=Coemansia erecta TaxID=147472 RepID=A0A9W8CSM2_9FUNG|nr:hypothetical protein LPJ53_002842 [Coemansia erecta]
MWLDCDVGHDDAMALILAASSPHLKLLGVSSVYGNSSVENTTANAIRVIQAAGIKGVKVYKGAAKPLVKNRVYASDIHGSSGLDGTDLLPDPDMSTYLAQDENAVNAMHRTIMASPEPVSLAAVGPLTNIALLLSIYPEVIPRIKTLAIMGGSMGIGNTTSAAEFNIYSDPEAAHIVLHSGISHIALVPLDVTHTVLATKQIIKRIQDEVAVPKFARLITDLLLYFGSTYKDVFGEKEGAPLHDPVAVAYLFMRNVFTERHIRIDIDCNEGHGRGRTFCDVYKKTMEPANCWLVTSVELEPFWNQMFRRQEIANSSGPSVASGSSAISNPTINNGQQIDSSLIIGNPLGEDGGVASPESQGGGDVFANVVGGSFTEVNSNSANKDNIVANSHTTTFNGDSGETVNGDLNNIGDSQQVVTFRRRLMDRRDNVPNSGMNSGGAAFSF